MKRVRPKTAELLDLRLCDRIAAVLPEAGPNEYDEINWLLDLGKKDRDEVLHMLEKGGAVTIGQALFELHYSRLCMLWRGFATLEQRYKIFRAFWDSLDRTTRRRLQIELGIGEPWPHQDFGEHHGPWFRPH